MSGSAAPSADAPRAPFVPAFWMLNSIEMFERLAFYTLRTMAPIYIMQADNPGGLHLTAANKGTIYFGWSVFQSILPMATGGFADRYGYKRTMTFAISMMMVGYLMIAFLRDIPGIHNFYTLLASILVLATGTAFFKPSIQGSLAANLNKSNSSLGWGIFYWVVNVGAFIGHYLPSVVFALRGGEQTAEAWRMIFLLSAVFTSFNFVLLFTFKDVPTGADKTAGMLTVLARTVSNIWPYWFVGGRLHPAYFSAGMTMVLSGVAALAAPGLSTPEQPWIGWAAKTLIVVGVVVATILKGGIFTWQLRLPVWILIMSGFWMMMYQLWDLAPNFITDWVDSSAVVASLSWLPANVLSAITEVSPLRGPQIPQQIFLSINAMCIIAGVVLVAYLTRRMRTLTAMLGGMILATIGVAVAGLTMSPWVLMIGIVFFSLGEMTTGPKKNEYLGLIAPPGKKGLYLGYVNIPAGIGSGVGALIAGYLYGHFGERAVLALRYLAEKTQFVGKPWDGNVAELESFVGVKRSDAFTKLMEVTETNVAQATQLLWDTYDPHLWVWIPFALIGVVSAISLAIFGQMAKRWSDMNA